MDMEKSMLESIVRDVVAKHLGQATANEVQADRDPVSGVKAVKLATVRPEPFDTGKAGDKVLLKDVLTLEESPRLGCGLMEMEATTFDWTLNYDEVDVVLEGSLSIVVNGRRITANKGEMVFIPKGTSIQFSVPEYAKFVYVTYPANWEAQ
jgi:ethanolamine utilization protein EutQ